MRESSRLETAFPASEVNRISTREANARASYRPVSLLHKYWARRPGSIFRALLLYAFLDEAEFTGKSFWDVYAGEHDLDGPLVVDPFMGGGTIVFEALRLGCRVAGKDLNPLSWFIARNIVAPVDVARLEETRARLGREVGPAISAYSQTACTCGCGTTIPALHFFWVKVVECSRCHRLNPLFNNHVVARVARKSKEWYVVCPWCLGVFRTAAVSAEVACPACGEMFRPRGKGPKRGTHFECQYCAREGTRHPQNIIETIHARGRKLADRLFAIECVCPHSNARYVKVPDADDHARFQRAREDLARLVEEGTLDLPFQARRESFSDRAINHGYARFRDMFNPRQLLGLGLLFRAIRALPADEVRDFFLLVFSDLLAYNNEFCEYNRSNKTLCWIWNKRTVISRSVYVENNLWGLHRGTGSFTKEFRKVLRAKKYTLHPYEKYFDGAEVVKAPPGRGVTGGLVDDSRALTRPATVYLECGDSRDLSALADASVDAVVTDPPYADYVMYADMANFYHAWLHLALKDRYAAFAPPLIDRAPEIVTDPVTGKSPRAFQAGIQAVFRACAKKLKDDGLLAFTYHHLDESAWVAIGEALVAAGYRVTALHHLTSEMRTNIHIQNKRRRGTSDVIFVCRKDPGTPKPVLTLPEFSTRVTRDLEASTRPLEPTARQYHAWGVILVLFSQYRVVSPRSRETPLALPEVFAALRASDFEIS